jgi:O-antigen ligase
MIEPTASKADRHPLADGLRRTAATCLALIPLAMAVAHRSSPLVITLAASAALAAVAAQRQLHGMLDQAGRRLRTPLGVAWLAFLAWAALSIVWSPAKATSLHAFGEFILPVAAAFVLALTLAGHMPRHAVWAFAGAAALACILIGLDLKGVGVRRALGIRSYLFLANRPALTLLVLLAPLVELALCLRRRMIALATAATAVAVVTGAILLSYSGAAKFGLAAGAAAFGATWLSRRLVLSVLSLALMAGFALAPIWGDAADRLLPASVHARFAKTHARERVDIWQSFGAAIREQPVLGAGFGASARFGQSPVAARVAPEYRPLLDIGHPHDAAVQVWAELGAIGAGLATLVGLLTLRGLADLPTNRLAARSGLFAAVLAVSSVGHGAWQGWWPAAIGAAMVWFTVGGQASRAAEPRRETTRKASA